MKIFARDTCGGNRHLILCTPQNCRLFVLLTLFWTTIFDVLPSPANFCALPWPPGLAGGAWWREIKKISIPRMARARALGEGIFRAGRVAKFL